MTFLLGGRKRESVREHPGRPQRLAEPGVQRLRQSAVVEERRGGERRAILSSAGLHAHHAWRRQ